MEQQPFGPQEQNELGHEAEAQPSKKYKYVVGTLSLLLVAGLATIVAGPEFFLGDIGRRCNAIPAQEESSMVAMVEEANQILAENSQALQIQRDLVSTHRDLNSNLGNSDLTEKNGCDEGAAYVDEVLGIPGEYGICVNQEEDITEFVQKMKDEGDYDNIKNNIVAFTGHHTQLAALPAEERQQVARLQQLLGSINQFQAKADENSYCDLTASVDIKTVTAQAGDYVL